jgi:hypothetical protein
MCAIKWLENYHEVRYNCVTARALINTAPLITATRFALLYPSGPDRKECAYLHITRVRMQIEEKPNAWIDCVAYWKETGEKKCNLINGALKV